MLQNQFVPVYSSSSSHQPQVLTRHSNTDAYAGEAQLHSTSDFPRSTPHLPSSIPLCDCSWISHPFPPAALLPSYSLPFVRLSHCCHCCLFSILFFMSPSAFIQSLILLLSVILCVFKLNKLWRDSTNKLHSEMTFWRYVYINIAVSC